MAAVMLLNEGKQWFKSASGWNTSELPEERALCSWAFETDGPTIIEDMSLDSRTAAHAFVTGAPMLRFFAAYPLLDEAGWPVGGFCAADVKPRILTGAEQRTLLDLAKLVQCEILSKESSPEASLAAMLAAARQKSMIDPVTRIWNRRGAHLLLRNAFERADESDRSLALAVVDIDGFGEINERFGPQIGDEVLRKFAARLVDSVRGLDLVFRLVDDRFLLLLTDVSEATAEKVVDRVRRSVSVASVPTRVGNVTFGARAGFAMRAPSDDASIDQLVAQAQLRMGSQADLPRNSAPAAQRA